jgi:hypothetical protein
MAALKADVKAYIVQALACFDTPTQVVASVKEEFGLEITRQQAESYDPTKSGGACLAQKWRDIFNQTRERFRSETAEIPIANKAFRLRALNRMAIEAERRKNYPLAAQLMEQAAKESGGAYTNKQIVDHKSTDGTMSPKGFTAAEYAEAESKLKKELPDLD